MRGSAPSRVGRVGRRVMCVYLLLLGATLAVTPAAEAAAAIQPFVIKSFTQRDVNGDGQPDVAEIHCQCYSANDRITVVDSHGNMHASTSADDGTDMTDDLWLFDVGNRGFYQIAVQFSDAGGVLSANVFEDENGDGRLDVGQQNGLPVVTEPGYPAIHVVAIDGYWQRNGRIAPDFDLNVDARMLATFGGELYEQQMKNDGNLDVVIHVRGPSTGDPRSYDWRNVYTPVPATSGIYRTTLMVREKGSEPTFPPVFPWMLLGGTYGSVQSYAGVTKPTVPLAGSQNRPYGLVKPYGESFPPIQVDWNAGKIAFIGEFVASRASPENWFTYSINRVEPNAVTDPDFESPFAFYDLTGQSPNQPTLAIRTERITANEPFGLPQWQGRAYQEIRYSWEQAPGQDWSYKVGLLGNQSIDTTVKFPGFTLQTVPYDDYPTWVTSHSWPIATFAAVEEPTYRSTEGVYDWDPSGAVRDSYYAGDADTPTDPFPAISRGIRGEYDLNSDSQPWLYFSPIDARLHLLGATAGLYNVDGTTSVAYQSLAENGHIDSWQLISGGNAEAQLIQTPSALLYTNESSVSIMTAAIPPEIFRTLPPTNHDQWAALGTKLSDYKKTYAANDLAAMFNQFSGRVYTIQDASMRDFRFTADGYRFILDLKSSGNLNGFPIHGVSGPGTYVIQYHNASQTFDAQPATSAAPAMSSLNVPARATALSTINVTADVSDAGLQDLSTLPIIVTAQQQGYRPIVIKQQAVDVASGVPTAVSGAWQPPRPGTWTVSAKLYLPDGTNISKSTIVTVTAARRPAWSPILRAGWPATSVTGYIGLLVGLVMFPLSGGFILVRRWR